MLYTYALVLTSILIFLKLVTSRKFYELLLYSDLMTVLISLYLVIVAFSRGTAYYLDISIVMVLLSFIGTAAITRYVTGGEE